MVRIKAPAKINLSLSIIGKQAHFHEVEMIMTTIDLADYITITKTSKSPGKVTLKSDFIGISLGKTNLVYQAAIAFIKHFKIADSVEITIEKNIPIAGGLAGGSADAAATFKGLRDLFEVDATDQELCNLGANLGSDIPFCIIGKTALATGRGEIITPIKPMPHCWVIIVNPRISVSTRDIYEAFDFNNAKAINTASMIDAIEAEDFDAICKRLANNLEPVTAKFYPIVYDIMQQLQANGANGVCMSGSGPSVFALVYTQKKAHYLYNQMKKTFPKFLVCMSRMLR